MKRLIIKAPRIELITEALRTLPVNPVYFYVEFLAYGIKQLNYKDGDKAENEYLRLCKEKGVMPYTYLKLESASAVGTDIFVSSRDPLVEIVEKSSELKKRNALARILTGGKLYQIDVGTKESRLGGNYPLFKDELLDRLLTGGYQPVKAYMWLNSMTVGSCQDKGEEGDTTLDINSTHPGLSLDIGNEKRLGEDRERLERWFSALDHKYGNPAQLSLNV